MKLNAVAFEGEATFGIEVSGGEVAYERALAKLGAEADRFRAAYGGYVKSARYASDRIEITLAFGGRHNPEGYPPERPSDEEPTATSTDAAGHGERSEG